MTSKFSTVMDENLKYIVNLKKLKLASKMRIKVENVSLGDEGCTSIFMNLKFIAKLEFLNLSCNDYR